MQTTTTIDKSDREAALRCIASGMEALIRDACGRLALLEALMEHPTALGIEENLKEGIEVTVADALASVREARDLWRQLFDLTVRHAAAEAGRAGQ